MAVTFGPLSSAYDFGDRLTAAFPSQLIVDTTEVCNLACTHCPHPTFKQTDRYKARMLEPELVAKAVSEVAAAGRGLVQQIRFTSEGEPLAHRQLFAMLADAVTRSQTFVSLTTNGVLLTDRRVAQLLATGVHMVDVSIDAFEPETYARIRVGGRLSVTRANVLRLIRQSQESRARTRVVVSYVEQPENRGETAAFERFWRDAGAADVVVRRMHSAAGAVIPIATLMRQRTAAIARRPCVYPWERVVLTPRGTLAFCPADWTHGSSLADYRTTTIAELWQGPQYRALRDAHRTNDYRAHDFCGQCPDWQETRWPHEGASYATLVEQMRGSA